MQLTDHATQPVRVQDVTTGRLVWHAETETFTRTTDEPVTTGQGVYLDLDNGGQIMAKLDDLIQVATASEQDLIDTLLSWYGNLTPQERDQLGLPADPNFL